jgi:hypothetical protein
VIIRSPLADPRAHERGPAAALHGSVLIRRQGLVGTAQDDRAKVGHDSLHRPVVKVAFDAELVKERLLPIGDDEDLRK